MSVPRLIRLMILLFISGFLFSQQSFGENLKEMWMGENDIHYRIDDHMQIRRTGSSVTARNRLAADCVSDITNAEYACYMAARVSMDLKDKKRAREYLARAMQKNYRFVEPVNAWKAWFTKEPLPVPGHPVHLFTEAVRAAQAGKEKQVIGLIKTMLEQEISADIIISNPLLHSYAAQPEIAALVAKTKEKQANKEERRQTGLWISPLYKVLNTGYDRRKHRKVPDENELLYGFYNALSAKDVSEAVIGLNQSYEKILHLSKNGKFKELPAYYLVYVSQDKRLARIRKSSEFKTWFATLTKTHNIDENWLNTL